MNMYGKQNKIFYKNNQFERKQRSKDKYQSKSTLFNNLELYNLEDQIYDDSLRSKQFKQNKVTSRPLNQYSPPNNSGYKHNIKLNFQRGQINDNNKNVQPHSQYNESNTKQQNRRDYAKKIELEMKMKNIDEINNKINALLNMVKRQKPIQLIQQTINRQKSQKIIKQSRQPSKFIIIKKQKIIQRQDQYYLPKDKSKQKNKSIMRLRQLSSLSPTLFDKQAFSNDIKSKLKSRKKSQQKNQFYMNQDQNYVSFSTKNDTKKNIFNKNQSSKKEEIAEKTVEQKGKKIKLSPSYQKFELYQQKSNTKKDAKSPMKKDNKQITSEDKEKYISPGSSQIPTIKKQIRQIKQKMKNSPERYLKYQQKQFNSNQSNKNQYDTNIPQFTLKIYPIEQDFTQSMKIAQKLMRQIQFDRQIRHVWIKFTKIQGQEKWKELQSQFKRNNLIISIQQIKILLTGIYVEFNNIDDNFEISKRRLINQLCNWQKFWENQVIGCASSRQLQAEGFDISEYDSGNKGYLTIQDMNNFVNRLSGRYYSNRDFSLIYKRLQMQQESKNSKGIELITFLKAFSS